MVFKCIKGMFKIERNFRDAFNEEAFIDKYIEECFDKYRYVVGDISSGILRLKGIALKNERVKNPFFIIDNYLETSCPIGCPYYVLKKIDNEDEYNKLLALNEPVKETDGVRITPIVKESFDKESLILEVSSKNKPNIVIDSKKMNSIPKGELPLDLKEAISNDNNNSRNDKKEAKVEPQVETTTYVSASPDFDPTKKMDFKKNNKKPQNNNGNNNANKKPQNNSNNNTNGFNKNNKKKKKNKKPNEA